MSEFEKSNTDDKTSLGSGTQADADNILGILKKVAAVAKATATQKGVADTSKQVKQPEAHGADLVSGYICITKCHVAHEIVGLKISWIVKNLTYCSFSSIQYTFVWGISD